MYFYKILFILFLSFFCFHLNAQEVDENGLIEGCLTTAPAFPAVECAHLQRHEKPDCGKSKMMEFIYKEIEYPKEALEQNIQGKVYLRLTVNEKGRISDAQVLVGPGGGCGEEVLRVIEKMKQLPAWTPGWNCWTKQSETMSFTIPIQFKVEYKRKEDKPK